MRIKTILGFDILLFSATCALMIIGVLFIFSSGVTSTGVIFSNEYIKQIVWASTGLLILIGISFLDYGRLREFGPYIYGACILLLVVTLIFGQVVNGAKSWFIFWGFGFQPSEFTKIATIILLAVYLEKNGKQIHHLPQFLISFLIMLLPVGLILLQPDLGTAFVFLPIFLIMTFTSGARIRHILFIILSGLLLIILTILPAWEHYLIKEKIQLILVLTDKNILKIVLLALVGITGFSLWGFLVLKKKSLYWILYCASIIFIAVGGSLAARAVLKDYQIMRLIVFLNPDVDPKGAGWNIIQSVTAVGSGGFWGKGFLQGTQSHYRFLPQQSTDFIFSIIAEEWGFFGALAIFCLFLCILIRGLFIISQAKDNFAMYTGAGILGMIFFHLIVNIGMAIGIMPITGIPLFFLSYGGSSLWTAVTGIGILMNIYLRRY